MGKRVPASAKTRKRIEELMDGRTVAADSRSDLLKLAMRVLLEEAGEAEVRDIERAFTDRRGRCRLTRTSVGAHGTAVGGLPGRVASSASFRAGQTWRKVVIGEFELKQIEELQRTLDDEFKSAWQRSCQPHEAAQRRVCPLFRLKERL